MSDTSVTWAASRRRRASARPTQPALVQPGGTLADRYRILAPLGEGGMGIVYAAEHMRLGKRVAIKVLAPAAARDRELVARFEQEARAASRIGHEHIVDVTDFGESDGGAAFIVMEYLEGCDLGRALAAGPMPIARVARILWQVCRAVGAAHGKGIVHRDLKPENIFLVERESQSDFVKVLDFGLAKVVGDDSRPRLTREGTVFGTSYYMSPEQARGEVVDGRSDVYAAGCILFEMLTGDVPFEAPSFQEVVKLHLAEPPPRASARAPTREIPPAVDEVVLCALAKNRSARFPTMKALALALCDAIGGDPRQAWPDPSQRSLHVATPAPSPPASRAGAIVLAVGALTFAGVLGAALALHHARARATMTTATPPPIAPAPASAAAPSPPSLPPAPVAAAAPSHIRVESEPSGAEVRRDGALLGRTPLVFDADARTPPFDVELARRGYKSATLHVAPDRDRQYVQPLERARAAATSPPAPDEPRASADKPPPSPDKPPPSPDKPPPSANKPRLDELKSAYGE